MGQGNGWKPRWRVQWPPLGQRGRPQASWPVPGHRSPGRNAAAFCSAARCRCLGGGPRELPGGATRAQAGLAALGFRDGGQRVGSDIGAHAPAAFRRQTSGDGALIALAAQGAAQRVHAGGSGRGRCRERHAVQCRAASHGQGVRGYGVAAAAGARPNRFNRFLSHRCRWDLPMWRCSLPPSATMGRHPKVLGDALFGTPQCVQDTDPCGAGAALQTVHHVAAGLGWCNNRLREGWTDNGGGRRFMGHGRDVPFRTTIRKVEFHEALLQKF